MKTSRILASTLGAALLAAATGTACAESDRKNTSDPYASIDSGAQSSDYNGSRYPASGTGPGRGVGHGPNTGGGGAIRSDKPATLPQYPPGYHEKVYPSEPPPVKQ
jgi:hypothetical protein